MLAVTVVKICNLGRFEMNCIFKCRCQLSHFNGIITLVTLGSHPQLLLSRYYLQGLLTR